MITETTSAAPHSSDPPLCIAGSLEAYFETGTEGVVWSITLPGIPGYDSLFCLNQGDGLRIYGERGVLDWEGDLDLEFERCWSPYPMNPSHGQQAIGGFWVHGLQRNRTPEQWSEAFFKQAPAVALLRSGRLREVADTRHLLAFLATLGIDPEGSWDRLKRSAPTVSGRIAAALDGFHAHTAGLMGWPKPLPCATSEEQAQALLCLVAVARDQRVEWEPIEEENRLARARGRWPAPPSRSEAMRMAIKGLPYDPG